MFVIVFIVLLTENTIVIYLIFIYSRTKHVLTLTQQI